MKATSSAQISSASGYGFTPTTPSGIGDRRPCRRAGRDTGIVDVGQDLDDELPDLDAMVALIAAEVAAAFQADRQSFREQIESAAERGETGYIQISPSTVGPSEKRAKSWQEIAPLMAAQASKLRQKVASLGLTAEEASLLSAAEHWLQRFPAEPADSQEA